MADGKVTVELSVQDAQALAAWQRGRKGIEDMKRELGGVGSETKKSARASSDMVTQFVGGFARMATGALTFSKAISLASSEYDAMIARQKAAAGFQVSVAGAQRAALRNLSGTELTPKQLDERLRAIQAATGADLGALNKSAADVLSARGTISEAEAVGQISAVAKMDASMAPDEMSKIAGAALDIRKAFGGGAEQAVGALLTAQQTARVTDTQAFATSAVPALFAMSMRGDTFRESSALYSTLSQQSADVTGERSGTAMIRFAQQIVQATAAVDQLKDASVTARMEFLLSGDAEGEEIRRSLVGNLNRDYEASSTLADQEYDPTHKAKLTGEAKQFFTLIELLERGSPTRKAYQATLAATPEYGQAGKRFHENLQAQADLGLQATARIEEMGRGALQTAQSHELEAKAAATKESLEKVLEQVGGFGRPLSYWLGAETGKFSPFMFRSQLAAEGLAAPETALIETARVAEARLAKAEASGDAAVPEHAAKVAALKSIASQARAEAEAETNRRIQQTIVAAKARPAMEVRSLAAKIRENRARDERTRQAAEELYPAGVSTIRLPPKAKPSAAQQRAERSAFEPRQPAADLADALRPAERQRKADADKLLEKQDELVDLLRRIADNTSAGGTRTAPAYAAPQRQPPVIGGN